MSENKPSNKNFCGRGLFTISSDKQLEVAEYEFHKDRMVLIILRIFFCKSIQ